MKRQDIQRLVLQATDGVAKTTVDTLLFFFYLYGAGFGKMGSRGIYRMFDEAESALSDLNYDTIKRAIHKLTQEELIKRSTKRSALEITITGLGKKRIRSTFPIYRTNRPWDGHVYLISYDISERQDSTRDLLRLFIRKTGGALLQESLWINPYNPKQLLEEFTTSRHVEGSILVSKLGKDGAIGDESFMTLIKRVYDLDALAKRYRQFIQTYEHTSSPSLIALTFAYHSILKDDPQLPYPLLPSNFPSKQAYDLFTKLSSKICPT